MAKIQAVWALDIGQAAMKALKLAPGETPDQVVAEAFDYIEYPKILSQPDADPEELVRQAMTTFLERNEVKGARVAIGVPGQTGLVKFIKLPPVEKKRIPDIVKFEARQQIPFALEEVIWDWQEISSDDEEEFSQTEVGLFAMKRDQIQRSIQPFQSAGIEVDLVQMSPIALYNFIAFDRLRPPEAAAEAEGEEGEEPRAAGGQQPAIEPGGSIVLLDIGADNSDLIITDGQRIWQRNVPIGGNHFTRALTKELKLTFAKAEHLKRNATKAPDPRAVFTAMRGVFNDFASEINRSIGFYGSVNRQAKVVKLLGLGNGFKLPGLQKFLQQNLNMEVDKLEHFDRLAGEEVTAAPQFQENVPSFAVAYGLGLQGLDLGRLRTNLLPGEIAQTRLIRAKKPWALVAAATLLLAFSSLALGDFLALKKVSNPEFKSAVEQAKSVKQRGDQFKSAYNSDLDAFKAKKSEGEKLVQTSAEGVDIKELFQVLSEAIYDPKVDPEFQDLSFDNPSDRQLLETLRVHIDSIRPVYKSDLQAWFNNTAELPERAKNTMHPFDRENPPQGAGWVIEIIGHHYNPWARDREGGPYFFLTNRVLPRFWEIPFRRFGLSHAALRWMVTDATWTSEKALANNGIPAGAPQLAHATPAAKTTGGMGYGSSMPGTSGGMGIGMGSDGASMEEMYAQSGMGMMPGGEGYGMDTMMDMMMGGRTSAFGSSAVKEEDMTYLTRTDFVIYVVWQPPTEEKPAPDPAELAKKLREAQEKFGNAVQAPNLAAFEEESKAESVQAVQQAMQQAAPPQGASAPAPGTEGTTNGTTAPVPGANAPAPGAAVPAPGGTAPAPAAGPEAGTP